MKSIAFRDVQGGPLKVYQGPKDQKRMDRIRAALEDLRHTGRIVVYLIKGNRTRRLFAKGY